MNEKTVSNFNIDHVLKQKSKNLPNGFVYSVVNGKTEMHEVGKLQLVAFGDKDLNTVINELFEEKKTTKKELEKYKKVLKQVIQEFKEYKERVGIE